MAKTDSLKKPSFNIIDGDYVEQFCSLDEKYAYSIISHMMMNNKEGQS